ETRITGGTLSIGSAATTADTAMSSGTLTGNGVFTTTHTFDWSGGTMSGQAGTEIPVGASLDMGNTSATRDIVQRTVNNRGSALMSGSNNNNISRGNGAILHN